MAGDGRSARIGGGGATARRWDVVRRAIAAAATGGGVDDGGAEATVADGSGDGGRKRRWAAAAMAIGDGGSGDGEEAADGGSVQTVAAVAILRSDGGSGDGGVGGGWIAAATAHRAGWTLSDAAFDQNFQTASKTCCVVRVISPSSAHCCSKRAFVDCVRVAGVCNAPSGGSLSAYAWRLCRPAVNFGPLRRVVRACAVSRAAPGRASDVPPRCRLRGGLCVDIWHQQHCRWRGRVRPARRRPNGGVQPWRHFVQRVPRRLLIDGCCVTRAPADPPTTGQECRPTRVSPAGPAGAPSEAAAGWAFGCGALPERLGRAKRSAASGGPSRVTPRRRSGGGGARRA